MRSTSRWCSRTVRITTSTATAGRSASASVEDVALAVTSVSRWEGVSGESEVVGELPVLVATMCSLYAADEGADAVTLSDLGQQAPPCRAGEDWSFGLDNTHAVR